MKPVRVSTSKSCGNGRVDNPFQVGAIVDTGVKQVVEEVIGWEVSLRSRDRLAHSSLSKLSVEIG